MASRVVTQGPELLTKLADLRVPHGIIRTEGIREHQYGFSALTFQRVMDAGISRFKDGHFEYFSPAGILPQRAAKPDSGNGWLPSEARRVPESRQFLDPHRCTWCKAHICRGCPRADRAPWLPAARR